MIITELTLNAFDFAVCLKVKANTLFQPYVPVFLVGHIFAFELLSCCFFNLALKRIGKLYLLCVFICFA